MFNLGFGEIVVIGIIALIFIGPKQLPEVARAVAKFLNELKRASSEATGALMSVKDEAKEYMNKIVLEEPSHETKPSHELQPQPKQQPEAQTQQHDQQQITSLDAASAAKPSTTSASNEDSTTSPPGSKA